MPIFRKSTSIRKIYGLQILCSFVVISINAQNHFPDYSPIYQDDIVARIDITLPPDSLMLIIAPGNEESDYPYHATFIFDSGTIRDTFEDVGLSLRGNTSRHAQKKSFQVALNTYAPGRRWYGVEKIDLNGEHNDPTVSRSKICWDLLRAVGVPAPRSSHVELYINNEYFGLYANVEHIDEEFVKTRFGKNDGNLYKCLWPADLKYLGTDPEKYKLKSGNRRVYELKTNEETDDYSDLAHFIDILNRTPIVDLPCELEDVLNVHTLLLCIAFDVLSGNWDDPFYNKNNFFLYHNSANGLFEYIPYDLDNTFGIDWFGVDWSTRDIYSWGHPSEPRPLFWRILEVPAYKAEYSYLLNKIVHDLYKEGVLFPRMDSLKTMLAPYVANDDYYTRDYGFSLDDFNKGYSQALPYGHTPIGIKPFIGSRRSATINQLELTDIPPILYNVSSNHPTSFQEFTLQVSVEDDQGIVSVEASIQLNSTGQVEHIGMIDDGQHQDGEAGDGTYGLIWPPLNECDVLSYSITAKDLQGNENNYPHCGAKQLTICNSAVTLSVNEFMASNQTTIADEDGEYDDVYLGDKYLSDKADNPTKWKFPDISMQAEEYLLIWADEDGSQGDLHANFKLSAGSEYIGIYDNDTNGNALIDGLDFGEQQTDVSYGRLPNGTGPFQFLIPTPGSMNESTTSVGEEINSAEYHIYPNPANDVIWILSDQSITASQTVQLMDVYGRVLMTNSFSGNASFDISGLPTGIYVLCFGDDGVVSGMRKVVKE